MLDYILSITNLKRDETSLVKEVHYAIQYVYRDKPFSLNGILHLEKDPNESNFIPYQEITEQTVIEWLKSKMGNDYIEKSAEPFMKVVDESIEIESQNLLQIQQEQEEQNKLVDGLPW